MRDEIPTRRFPRVPMERRVAAFAIDVCAVSLVSLFGGSAFAVPLFLLAWFGLRVVLVERNKGQSLGRWAMDIKVIDPKYGSLPTLTTLLKREVVTGVGSLLVFVGLVNLSPTNGFILVAPLLLLVDCTPAFLDTEYRQAYHDRLARTMMIQTRRGYSLDLKLKTFIAKANRRVK
jgi:uncharacterized RDD family membrane protein YckC